MSTFCSARNCGDIIPEKALFCIKHWRKLSPRTRELLLGAYRNGQPHKGYQVARERKGERITIGYHSNFQIQMDFAIEELYDKENPP